ncbi:MAG: hypothetical protein HAW67_03370 [Endozoicomonadaceae bacterium]|nr:hypothetical protein [Endozoicomonadaceae bacterium]
MKNKTIQVNLQELENAVSRSINIFFDASVEYGKLSFQKTSAVAVAMIGITMADVGLLCNALEILNDFNKMEAYKDIISSDFVDSFLSSQHEMKGDYLVALGGVTTVLSPAIACFADSAKKWLKCSEIDPLTKFFLRLSNKLSAHNKNEHIDEVVNTIESYFNEFQSGHNTSQALEMAWDKAKDTIMEANGFNNTNDQINIMDRTVSQIESKYEVDDFLQDKQALII